MLDTLDILIPAAELASVEAALAQHYARWASLEIALGETS